MGKPIAVEEMLDALLKREKELNAKDLEWVRKIDESASKRESLELTPRQEEVIAGIYEKYSGAKQKAVAASQEKSTGERRKHVTIYTDGSSRGNPGPGGYGTVLLFGKFRKELSQGYRHTTNNRMEMRAAIAGLEALFEDCEVTLHTDSQYLAKGFNDRWIEGWKRRGWKNSQKEPVKNKDLWQQLDALNQRHKIRWKWVKGHAGNQENERCDELATEAADGDQLIDDDGFESEAS